MTGKNKIKQLSELIDDALLPLIDGDYVHWGLPNHSNIGDLLIWMGELDMLKRVKHRCLGVCQSNCAPNMKLSEDTIILIHGGGNFGDVWRDIWLCFLNSIKDYKHNKIIFLPNTIWYNDMNICRQDAAFLSEFDDLTICARDKQSYDIACSNFSSKVLLVPDMAFHMNLKRWQRWNHRSGSGTLYLKRVDHELKSESDELASPDMDIRDWPPLENKTKYQQRLELFFNKIEIAVIRKLITKKFGDFLITKIFNYCHPRIMTIEGVKFISSYDKIYTTRLHGMILSILLGRETHFIDNSYGKLSSYYRTWLTDCENVYDASNG